MRQNRSRTSSFMSLKFPYKLWKLATDNNTPAIHWSPDGKSLRVVYSLFQSSFMNRSEKYFKTCNIDSFVRQLNLYGFKKATQFKEKIRQKIEDVHEFRNPNFLKGRPELLIDVSRKLTSHKEQTAGILRRKNGNRKKKTPVAQKRSETKKGRLSQFGNYSDEFFYMSPAKKATKRRKGAAPLPRGKSPEEAPDASMQFDHGNYCKAASEMPDNFYGGRKGRRGRPKKPPPTDADDALVVELFRPEFLLANDGRYRFAPFRPGYYGGPEMAKLMLAPPRGFASTDPFDELFGAPFPPSPRVLYDEAGREMARTVDHQEILNEDFLLQVFRSMDPVLSDSVYAALVAEGYVS